MRSLPRCRAAFVFVLAIALFGVTRSSARGDALSVVPADSAGFVVLHKVSEASASLDGLAKLVGAPAPGVWGLWKDAMATTAGLDEQGDAVLVLVDVTAGPNGVALLPVKDFAALFAAMKVDDPGSNVIEVKSGEGPYLAAKKGNYLATAQTAQRASLDHVLNAKATLEGDSKLTQWVEASQASVVLTTNGVKQLAPRLKSGLTMLQMTMRQMAGEQGKTAADAFQLYIDLLNSAEGQIARFGLALRVDSAQTVSLVKQVQFTPGGSWAQWAAGAEASNEDVLSHFPVEPFVFAGGGAIPKGSMDGFMDWAMRFSKQTVGTGMTDEQWKKYADAAARSVRSVSAIRVFMGPSDASKGLYDNVASVMTVDDSAQYLKEYEVTLAELRQLAESSGSKGIPKTTSRRIPFDGGEAIEVSMNLADFPVPATPGGPDPKQALKMVFGDTDVMKTYIAAADDHTVVMAYNRVDRLQSLIAFTKSGKPGLEADARIAKVKAALPEGAQGAAYFDVGNLLGMVRQIMQQTAPQAPQFPFPELAASPPIGIGAKVSPEGVEGRLVITAETLSSIGDAVKKMQSGSRR